MKDSLVYKKHNSFLSLKGKNEIDIKKITSEILELYDSSNLDLFNQDQKKILKIIIKDLKDSINEEVDDKSEKFNLKQNVIDEIKIIDSKDILRYLIHRYRYEICMYARHYRILCNFCFCYFKKQHKRIQCWKQSKEKDTLFMKKLKTKWRCIP